MTQLDQFLEVLKAELPEVCADKILISKLPSIFKNHGTLHRMRSRGQAPSHFQVDPNIYYLRDDVLNWLRSRYVKQELPLDLEHAQGVIDANQA